MSCPGCRNEFATRNLLHWQSGAYGFCAVGQLLDFGMPHFGARFELRSADAVLRKHMGFADSPMLAFACAIAPLTLIGADQQAVDLRKLPPAATNRVDFARDVQPMFERSCLRCHGPERPKSKFRLDNRAAALQGGEDNREDIIPGDSAHSPLIHYVARLVKEMGMPPPGKGEPLTHK